MTHSTTPNDRPDRETAAMEGFLQSPSDESFTELFLSVTPQLVSFFRARGCRLDLSEDLSQEVLLTVYRKAGQLRDRLRFRAWLFAIARHALYRHYGKQSPVTGEVDFDNVMGAPERPGPPAFEFRLWMELLEPCEREVLTLRFVEEWEYHEIAAAKSIPIGTVQWRVFNAKKKLSARLRAPGPTPQPTKPTVARSTTSSGCSTQMNVQTAIHREDAYRA
jgi:RNA polymerase sigma-70 factor (ECF subfamily)